MRRGLGGLILLGALAFALSGCAQPGPATTPIASQPQPSTETPATPTPTRTPEPEPAHTVAAFGGDCNELISPDVAATQGATLRPNDTATTSLAGWEPGLSDSYLRIGAFSCVWVLSNAHRHSVHPLCRQRPKPMTFEPNGATCFRASASATAVGASISLSRTASPRVFGRTSSPAI